MTGNWQDADRIARESFEKQDFETCRRACLDLISNSKVPTEEIPRIYRLYQEAVSKTRHA